MRGKSTLSDWRFPSLRKKPLRSSWRLGCPRREIKTKRIKAAKMSKSFQAKEPLVSQRRSLSKALMGLSKRISTISSRNSLSRWKRRQTLLVLGARTFLTFIRRRLLKTHRLTKVQTCQKESDTSTTKSLMSLSPVNKKDWRNLWYKRLTNKMHQLARYKSKSPYRRRSSRSHSIGAQRSELSWNTTLSSRWTWCSSTLTSRATRRRTYATPSRLTSCWSRSETEQPKATEFCAYARLCRRWSMYQDQTCHS